MEAESGSVEEPPRQSDMAAKRYSSPAIAGRHAGAGIKLINSTRLKLTTEQRTILEAEESCDALRQLQISVERRVAWVLALADQPADKWNRRIFELMGYSAFFFFLIWLRLMCMHVQ